MDFQGKKSISRKDDLTIQTWSLSVGMLERCFKGIIGNCKVEINHSTPIKEKFMNTDDNTFQANLFYSYSHKDEKYRSNMETALAQLRRDKLLKEWSDHKIFSGQKISKEIKEKMDKTDIFVFLLSPDFIESDACIEEWEYAKQLAEKGKSIFRIPIILRDCAWIDFLNDDDVKALPNDGKPIANFDQEDTAWLQVYNGIKEVINELRKTFTPKIEVIRKMQEFEYDVALSFAGEDRRYAEELVKLLDDGGHSFFYDDDRRAELWGEDLYNYLYSIYKEKARYCVIFTSEHYVRKLWTNHELKSAQARAFSEKGEAYILPIRLDDTEVPGILPTVGYLDGRSTSIDEIYEILAEKLTGKPSQQKPHRPTSPIVEEDLGEYLLLSSEDQKLNFVPLQDVRSDSKEISVELLPESSEEIAFLRTLQNGLSDGFVSHRTMLACAYRDHAAWVVPQNIVETRSHWEVVLNIHDNRSNYGLFGNTNDQIAEMRARRILLNEKLDSPNSALTHNTGFDQLVSEIYIRGLESSSHEPSIQVLESPIPLLYKQFKQTPEKFKKFAYLISILYLKLSNTIENVHQLDLELRSSTQLYVKFKGVCQQIASTVDPSILEFEGICPLSD